jgi:hypothetical protein
MKGKTPNKAERLHMEKVREFGCIVCNMYFNEFRPAAIHHMEGSTKPGSHMKVLPLCYDHHQGGSDREPFISRHPYKTRFEAAYGSEYYLLTTLREQL